MLLLATLAALGVANSPLSDIYHSLLELELTFGFPSLKIEEPILGWINDGFMAIFFLLVGLEIKSELKFGRLSSFRSAFSPVVAAVAGAMVPALIF